MVEHSFVYGEALVAEVQFAAKEEDSDAVIRKRLILARLKERASEFRCVRLRDAKCFSREPARGVAA